MEYARVEGRFPVAARADGTTHWLVPTPHCRRCMAPLAEEPCARCASFEGTPLARVVAATLYLSPDSQFKWPHAREIAAMKEAGVLADAYAEVLARLLADQRPFDAVVPIPGRENAAPGALARELAARLGAPVVEALALARPVARQKTLKREARAMNMAGAMAPTRNVGARVLVVDDVAASCATLLEAARALGASGARECVGAVAGRDSSTYALAKAGIVRAAGQRA